MRAAKLAAILLVMASACNSKSSVDVAPSTSNQEFSYGYGITVPPSPSLPSRKPTTVAPKGRLEIDLRDQNGRGPGDIAVDLVGPQVERAKSNSDGKLIIDLKPGQYEVSIPTGCDEAIQTLWGGTGRVFISAGMTTKGSLSVSWQHRYRPWPPADSSLVPWPVGQEVRVQFYVIDKCRSNNRAPGASYPSFIFESALLEITRPPNLTADDQGLGSVYIKCRDKGTPDLLSIDSDNRSDVIDLTKEDVSSGVDVRCT